MAISFVKGFHAVDGLFEGQQFATPTYLGQSPYLGTLPSSTSSFTVFGYEAWGGEESGIEGTKVAAFLNENMNLVNITQALYDSGYTSRDNPAELCTFALTPLDPLMQANKQLSFMAHSDGTVMECYMAIKDISTAIPTYNIVSVRRGFRDMSNVTSGFFAGQTTKSGTDYYVFGFYWLETYGTVRLICNGFSISVSDFSTLLGDPYDISNTEYSEQAGEGSQEGGYGGGIGTFDDHSDTVALPDPLPNVSDLGFVNIYKCGANALHDLGGELFPDITSATDVFTAIEALSTAVWNSRLIDYVISIHMMPTSVPAGSLEDIKVGTRTLTGIMGRKITSDYVDFDFGTINVAEYYENFIDYETRARLFLPFIGFVDISPEYWQSCDLQVKYRFNVIDGSFVAFVLSTSHKSKLNQSVIGQYSGCACMQLPTSGVSYASMFSGMIGGVSQLASSVASKDITASATSALNLGSAANSGNMQGSNSFNSTAAFMGVRKAYLLIERPIAHFPTRYAAEKGIPSLISTTLGQCEGFTTADSVILDGIPCTEAEKEKIREALRTGLIF